LDVTSDQTIAIITVPESDGIELSHLVQFLASIVPEPVRDLYPTNLPWTTSKESLSDYHAVKLLPSPGQVYEKLGLVSKSLGAMDTRI